MKITGDWLSDPAAQTVLAMLENAGHAAYAVGGCVRNSVFKEPVTDVDIATSALPEQVINLAKAAGINPIPTGIDHGTITVVSNGTPFEVTTFRSDVDTDGRHAKVSFSSNMTQDAKRRDFTMNALYCDRLGEVFDPLNGLPDTLARRLRFIGDAKQRITEDYLRILRFFRFFAQYCDPFEGIDPDGLAACAENIEGIKTLSKERIGAEMRKLLGAGDPAPALAAMQTSGVLMQVLTGANPQFLAPLVALEQAHKIAPSWLRRLAVIGTDGAAKALVLSKAEQKHLKQMGQGFQPAETAYLYGRDVALDDALVLAASLSSELSQDIHSQIELGARAVFPVKAADLMPEIPAGPALGQKLRQLEKLWIKSGFRLDKGELL